MTDEQAEAESARRWPGKWRKPIARRRGGKYQVGYDDSEFAYILGESSTSWEEAFAVYDNPKPNYGEST